LRRKLGLFTARDDDIDLATRILDEMQTNQVDFTQFFRSLGRAADGDNQPTRSLFVNPSVFDEWAVGWRQRLSQEYKNPGDRRAYMDSINPAYIPRNHRIEAMIQAAVIEEDFTPFEKFLEVIASPYAERPGLELFAEPPLTHERVTATYCGT